MSQLDAVQDLSVESVDSVENVQGIEIAEPPHIMFMLVDDLGWNDIGYNSDDMKGMVRGDVYNSRMRGCYAGVEYLVVVVPGMKGVVCCTTRTKRLRCV